MILRSSSHDLPPAAAKQGKRNFSGTRYCIPQMRGPEPRQRATPSALPFLYVDAGNENALQLLQLRWSIVMFNKQTLRDIP
jgi:hypothetical protein